MLHTTAASLDAVFAVRTDLYHPDIQLKFEDLTQDIDNLLCQLKQEETQDSCQSPQPRSDWQLTLLPAH